MATLAQHLRSHRVGVVMSSSFFGFYGHTGFLRALAARGVRPVAYSGASAGSMAAAFGAADGLEQLPRLFETLRRQDFWDPTLFVGRPPGLLRGHKLRDLLARHLPVARFEDCAPRLVTVATDLSRGQRHVDDAGDIATAVWASSALPLLFRPVPRLGGLHLDGGIVDKLPIRALIERAEVDVVVAHLIPSSGLGGPPPWWPGALIERALDVARDDGWRHQVALAEARGIEVHVVESTPPRVNPFKLRQGPRAMDAAERSVLRALDAPPTRVPPRRWYG